MSMFSNFVSTLRQFVVKTPQIQSVRYRYHAEKPTYIRRYGYKDQVKRSGLLAHYGDEAIRSIPLYKYVYLEIKIKYSQFIKRMQIKQTNCFIFTDQKIVGVRNERYSGKTTILTFWETRNYIQHAFYTIYRRGCVERTATNIKCY